ncbi:hypothetical protein DU002_12725 [Corallincola holothuriorum]|uniref:Uncharacterized protein n=1 Tax=Corallincola holothuriorum TaxID=2282215 RepID=A0A368NFF3_9GAMM|nr:hypothetical protein [Corallincola holothuriorum]RCU49208.1 hypothetical protein DU002_12725 [Corallincola holothuriorum]
MTHFEIVLIIIAVLSLVVALFSRSSNNQKPRRIPVQIQQPLESFECTNMFGGFRRARGSQLGDPDWYSLKSTEINEIDEFYGTPIIGAHIEGWSKPIKGITITRRYKDADPQYILLLETQYFPYSTFESKVSEIGLNVKKIDSIESDDVKEWVRENCQKVECLTT